MSKTKGWPLSNNQWIGVTLALVQQVNCKMSLTGALSYMFAESLHELPKLLVKHVTQHIGIIAVHGGLQPLILSL